VACVVDWQKTFDRVNWAKLMQNLKITGIDWRERKLISKLYVVQPKSSRNLNAARKPLVVQLWASRYRELYPL
jgi:hypothetical protein